MKKLKTYLKWVLVNGVMTGSLFAGYYQGVEGAKNVYIFLNWTFCVAALVMLALWPFVTDPKGKAGFSRRSVPALASRAMLLLNLGLLIWVGAWVMVTVHLLGRIIASILRMAGERHAKELAA